MSKLAGIAQALLHVAAFVGVVMVAGWTVGCTDTVYHTDWVACEKRCESAGDELLGVGTHLGKTWCKCFKNEGPLRHRERWDK